MDRSTRRAEERAIALLARRQHGVAARGQLIQAGIARHTIDNRLKSGRFRALHRGIYLITSVAPPGACEMAAVLACGEGAVVSHLRAGDLWRLISHFRRNRAVDVTVVRRCIGRRPGIRVHRVKALRRDEITRMNGIPVTTPARTLLDLAAEVTRSQLEQALAKAERDHLTSRTKLLALIARYPRRRGVRALRSLLDRGTKPALTRSQAERRLLALIGKATLPAPEINFKTERYELDFYWPDHRVAVEVDAFWTHSSEQSFEGDRRRDADLAAQGIQVVRVTDRHLAYEPEATLARLAQTLAQAAA